MSVAGVFEPVFERNAFEPDPGRKWSALDTDCPTHNVRAGTECPTGDFRRAVCAERVAWLRELIAAGEAGPGVEMVRPEREPARWNNSTRPSKNTQNDNALRTGPKGKVSTDAVAADYRSGLTVAASAEKHGVSFATISFHRKRARETGLL